MQTNEWPHLYNGTEPAHEIGKDDLGIPIMGREMKCIHCGDTFMWGKEGPKTDPCPARNDKEIRARLEKHKEDE